MWAMKYSKIKGRATSSQVDPYLIKNLDFINKIVAKGWYVSIMFPDSNLIL
jgi:hypothetical protein